VFWALIISSFIFPYFMSGNASIILVFIGILCVAVRLFWRKKEITNHLRHLTVGIAFLILLSSFGYHESLNIGESSKIVYFFRCWTFAGAEILLLNHFGRLMMKFLFLSAVFLLRCAFLVLFEHEAFVESVMMQNFITGIFVVYTFYHCEVRERMVFQDYYDYREEFSKFKDFLENHLPQSILLLSPQNFNPLFANKTFAKVFTKIFSSKNSEMHQTKHVNLLAVHALDLLQTQHDSVRYSHKWEPDASRLGNGLTLRHFLQELTTGGFFGMSAITIACFYQDPTGKKCLFEVVIMPLIWNRENAVAIVFNDITFQEKLMALKQADKNKDIIITTVSHELRTPVNAITGLLQIIEANTTQPEVHKDILLCRDNATILSSLINSIVDLQLFSKGKFRLKLTEVNLHAMLRDTVSLFQFVASQKDLYLKLKINDNVEKFIFTDENRLKQIIINLIGNAIKFTFHGGVEISIEKDPSVPAHLRLSVRDTGIGIKESQQKNLFKIYGNLEATNDVSKNGAGLGLTICNTLANALLSTKDEEKIHMESKHGVGTIFWFLIPKEISKPASSKSEVTNTLSLSNYDSSPIVEDHSEDCDENLEPNIFQSLMGSHTFCRMKSLTDKDESTPSFHSISHSFEEIPLKRSRNPQRSLFGQTPKACKSNSFIIDRTPKNHRKMPHKGLVLIVDDNPFNLMVAKSVLVNLAYEVETAASGEEALRKSRDFYESKRPLKFILMDIQMPVMDGYETTRQLKKMMETNEIEQTPIIALSANDQDEDIKNSLESGMVAHLSKPLHKDKLDACLSRL